MHLFLLMDFTALLIINKFCIPNHIIYFYKLLGKWTFSLQMLLNISTFQDYLASFVKIWTFNAETIYKLYQAGINQQKLNTVLLTKTAFPFLLLYAIEALNDISAITALPGLPIRSYN